MSSTCLDDEVLSRARAALRAAREADFAVLAIIAEIDSLGVASAGGYPSTERLLEDLFRIDRRDAKRLTRHATALLSGGALSGEAPPPRAPATAEAAADGALAPAHVDVVLDTLERLAQIPGLDPGVVPAAERTLAGYARQYPPRALARIAARLVAALDPDGVAPEEEPGPDDALQLSSRRDGTVVGRFAIHGAADAELLREVFDALATPAGPDDPRPLERRRAEALLDLLAQAVSPTGIAATSAETSTATSAQSSTDARAETSTTARVTASAEATAKATAAGAADAGAADAGAKGSDRAVAEGVGADGARAAGPHPPADASATDDSLTSTPPAGCPPDDSPPADSPPAESPPADHPPADSPPAGASPVGPSSADGPSGDVGDEVGPSRHSGDPAECRPVRGLGRATLTVTMPLEWLQRQSGHGLLDSEQPVSPSEARRLACDAGVVAMVLGARGQPLDVGRLSYTVPEGLRRALAQRDGGCAFPGCTRRPGRCAAHHIHHWTDGGATALENMTLLCRYHHRVIHHDHWSVEMRDGRPWFVPPPWMDPDRIPRPGGRHPVS